MLSDRHYMRDSYEPKNNPILVWMLGTLAAVFVLQNILVRWFSFSVGSEFVNALALSGDGLSHGKIWTLATYGLLHDGFFHIISSLLGLYFLGRALLPVLGTRHFFSVCGAALIFGGIFWLGINWSREGVLMGASSVVTGLFVVYACLNPDRPITLLLFFVLPLTVKPKHAALAFLAFDVCGLFFFELTGQPGMGIAHSAHLGGMAAGWLYARYFHELDLTAFSSRKSIELPRWFRKAQKLDAPPPVYRVNLSNKEDMRTEIDRILDKINSEGFQSLTAEEKSRLDHARDHLSRR